MTMRRAIACAARGAVLSLVAVLFVTPTATAQPAGRSGPKGITGTIIVTNKAPFTASIIDVASGRVLAVLPTGRGPHEIAITKDGRTAVVTDYGSGPGDRNTLTVIDVPGLKVERTINLAAYRAPHGIVFLPGDSIVAVTSEASRNVVLVHVASGTIRKAIGTTNDGSHMVGVAADGRTAFTGNIGSNSVSQLDLVAGTLVKSFPVPAKPEAINVTPDGREVWVGSNEQGRVSVLDPATGTVTLAADGVSWPYRVLFTPDVRMAVIPDMNNNDVRFVDRASRKELSRLTFPTGGPQGITITPDGRFLFLSLSKEACIAVIDARTRAVIGYIASGDTPDGVVYTTRVLAK